MHVYLAPMQANVKRFQSDLKRKLPTFPCSVSGCGLGYSDMIKIQKRADKNGINANVGENNNLDLALVAQHLSDLYKKNLALPKIQIKFI